MAKTAALPAPEATDRAGRRTGLEREDIVAAALVLVERDGPAALTMRRLATELGVGTPTIYWHISNRDELISEVVRMQATRLAEIKVTGKTARQRVYRAARHIWTSSIEHRAITSLAHQGGMSSLLTHHLEAALVMELEAAGLVGREAAEASRAILTTIVGALVIALGDVSASPPDYRPDALWAATDAAITPATRKALRTASDLDALSAVTLRAVVDHFVPA